MRRSILLSLSAATTAVTLAIGVAGTTLAASPSTPVLESNTTAAVDGHDFLFRERFVAAGDVNGDGSVDATDYLVWKSSPVALDADTDGDVDGHDFLVWRIHRASIVDGADLTIWRN